MCVHYSDPSILFFFTCFVYFSVFVLDFSRQSMATTSSLHSFAPSFFWGGGIQERDNFLKKQQSYTAVTVLPLNSFYRSDTRPSISMCQSLHRVYIEISTLGKNSVSCYKKLNVFFFLFSSLLSKSMIFLKVHKPACTRSQIQYSYFSNCVACHYWGH